MKTLLSITTAVALMLASVCVKAEAIEGNFTIFGSFFPVGTQLTGTIDLPGNTLQITLGGIFGSPVTVLVSEMLPPGSHTRTHNLSTGGSITRTGVIPAGATGGYLVINFKGDEHQLFFAWDVSSDGLTYTNVAIPGNTWIGGVYDGRTVSVNFTIFSNVAIDILDGAYECSEPDGSTITMDASLTLEGSAALDRVEWSVDGNFVGTGTSITEYFSLGGHTVEATVFTTAGVTATDSAAVTVEDTTPPNLQIVFTDSNDVPVASAINGDYKIRLTAPDICDQAPSITASASPVMQVIDGDIISIDPGSGNVVIPTTAVSVSATAVDTSGNKSTSQGVLGIQ
jgi:hypothetical protein